MDVSSQEKFIQNGQSSALDQVMSESNQEVNSKCAYDEKALKNHENTGNHKSIEAVNGSPICVPEVCTRITSSPRKTISEHERGMEEIQPMACDPIGLEKLEHSPDDASKHSNLEQSEANEANNSSELGNRKKGQPRKREKMDFTGSLRVLRSRSQEKSKVPEPVNTPVQDAGSTEKKRKKKRAIKKDQNNEFSKIKTHLRYLLSRMSYEQNFIDAYAGEGWKGQSLEKIRPEKELERAKSNIIRYKLKIRDLFQRMDSSCAEGRIPESLYDSEGLIDSEDIFCSKCGQTDVRLDNDIILCDGACERGFHQFCLEPPLLKEQVPPGDEGWLCPACDCKVDCVDLLNDSMGTHLSISDSWEKVFPESAASGNNLDDTSGLPSDDSEDDDYNPDGPEVEEEVDGEEASSDESDFSSASEDLGAVANKEQLMGLPSDDSEDDDFNPDGLGSDDEAKSKSSSSDFSSDSEDLGDIHKNEEPLSEVEGPLMSGDNEEKPNSNMEDGDFSPITAKRRVERLDYKKLHDETYGNVSSDSSDEDFFETQAPRSRRNTKGDEENQKRKQSESTPIRRTNKKLDAEGASALASSDTIDATSTYRRLGEAVTQRLYESFKENQYPDRNAKENLAKELNLTHIQVNKWFENARWSFNHPGKRKRAGKTAPEPTTNTPIEIVAYKMVENSQPYKATPERSITKQMNEASAERSITKQLNEASSASPKSRKRKPKADHHEAEASPNQSVRRSGRSQSKSAAESAS